MSQTVTHAKHSPKTGRGGRGLQLANPHITGEDVKAAQELLAAGPFGNFEPGAIDGEYGPATAEAVKQAKWMLGYPAKACDDSFGPQLATILKSKKLPPAYQVRRRQRLKEAAHQASVRGRIVELARWGIQNELSIHYQQLRPLDGLTHPQKLPLHTDCSGFSTLCYKWAGSEVDPNGANFCGAYTGTMLTHCRHIPRRAVQPGDLVVWGAYPGHHVALVLEPGSDPLLCSHGQEKGPLAIRFSAESKYQPTPATWLACLP